MTTQQRAVLAVALLVNSCATHPAPSAKPVAATPVSGEASEIAKSIRVAKKSIWKCYVLEREKKENLEGSVNLEFTILGDGTVEDLHVLENTTGSDGLADCVRGAIAREVSFPKQKDPKTHVIYPFKFTKE